MIDQILGDEWRDHQCRYARSVFLEREAVIVIAGAYTPVARSYRIGGIA